MTKVQNFYVQAFVYYTAFIKKQYPKIRFAIQFIDNEGAVVCECVSAGKADLSSWDLNSAHELAKHVRVFILKDIEDSSLIAKVRFKSLNTGSEILLDRFNESGSLGDYIARRQGKLTPSIYDFNESLNGVFKDKDKSELQCDTATVSAVDQQSSKVTTTLKERSYNADKVATGTSEFFVQIEKFSTKSFILIDDENAFKNKVFYHLDYLLYLYNVYSLLGAESELEECLKQTFSNYLVGTFFKDFGITRFKCTGYKKVDFVGFLKTPLRLDFYNRIGENFDPSVIDRRLSAYISNGGPYDRILSIGNNAVNRLPFKSSLLKDINIKEMLVSVHSVLDIHHNLVENGSFDFVKCLIIKDQPFVYYNVLALNCYNLYNFDKAKKLVPYNGVLYSNPFSSSFILLPVNIGETKVGLIPFIYDGDTLKPMVKELDSVSKEINKLFFIEAFKDRVAMTPMVGLVKITPFLGLKDIVNRSLFLLGGINVMFGEMADSAYGTEKTMLPLGLFPGVTPEMRLFDYQIELPEELTGPEADNNIAIGLSEKEKIQKAYKSFTVVNPNSVEQFSNHLVVKNEINYSTDLTVY